MFDVALLDDKAGIDRAEQLRRARKIRSGMSREMKIAIQTFARSTRRHPVSAEHLQELVDRKLIEKKFGRHYLTPLGRIVSLL